MTPIYARAASEVKCRSMKTKNPAYDRRIDAYIVKSAEFARPILTYLRELVHEAAPQIEETLKWGMPSFEYKGLVCGMAAFKQHCTFGFWKHALVVGDGGGASGKAGASAAARGRKANRAGAKSDEAMGEFGRITKISDLPSRRVLIGYVRKAVKLNEEGVKVPRPPRKPPTELVVPADLAAALRRSKAAANHFEAFSYSKRKDYIEWLTEAKTEETRNRRLATAIEWIAEGKSRNWKYERC